MGKHKNYFMNVPNGDAIAFDMKESEINPSVVYPVMTMVVMI